MGHTLRAVIMKSNFSKISAIALCFVAAFSLTGCGEMPTTEGSIVSEQNGIVAHRFFVIQDGEKVEMDCEGGFLKSTCSLDGITLTYLKKRNNSFYLPKAENTDGTKYKCSNYPASCIVQENNNERSGT